MIDIKKHLRNIIIPLSLVLILSSSHLAYSQENQDWVSESDAITTKLLEVIAKHNPESAARVGVDGYDEEISDLSSGYLEREQLDMEQAKDYLLSEYENVSDKQVKQDLQILITSVSDGLESSTLENSGLLPYHDVPRMVYMGISSLLQDRVPAEGQDRTRR